MRVLLAVATALLVVEPLLLRLFLQLVAVVRLVLRVVKPQTSSPSRWVLSLAALGSELIARIVMHSCCKSFVFQ